MPPSRSLESLLASITIGVLLVYVPVETIYSWRGGPASLADPYYLIDVVAFALLVAGVIRSLRARPHPRPDLLTAAWAWAAANFWRAFFDRLTTLRIGGRLDLRSLELRFVAAELLVALACLTLGVTLTLRTPRHP